MPSSDLDERDLYWITRLAIRDAIWDVIQKILTVILVVILISVGVGFASQGWRASAGPGGWLVVAFGLGLVAAAVVYFLREFDLLPFSQP